MPMLCRLMTSGGQQPPGRSLQFQSITNGKRSRRGGAVRHVEDHMRHELVQRVPFFEELAELGGHVAVSKERPALVVRQAMNERFRRKAEVDNGRSLAQYRTIAFAQDRA